MDNLLTITNTIILKFQIILSFMSTLFGETYRELLRDINGFSVKDIVKLFKLIPIINKNGNLTISTSNDGIEALFNTINIYMSEVVLPIGIALSTTFFILSIIDMATKDNSNLEHYIRQFIIFILGITIISKSWEIISYLIFISDVFIFQLGQKNIELTDAGTIKFNESANFDFWGFLLSFLPWIIGKIVNIGLFVVAAMRVLDISWRTVLFPIGVANIYDGGLNSPGIKYIKTYFGALLAGAMVVVLLILYDPFSYYLLGGTAVGDISAESVVKLCGTQIALLGACFGASNKIKEVFS